MRKLRLILMVMQPGSLWDSQPSNTSILCLAAQININEIAGSFCLFPSQL